MIEDEPTLARRVEALKGPDRLTDCLVWLLLGDHLGHPYSRRGGLPIKPGNIIKGRWFGSALEKYPEDIDMVAADWRVPSFTASYDAANTTMPNNVGSVLWAPIGKRPSVSAQIDGFWMEHVFGCNRACAMLATGLRAHHALQHFPDGLEDQAQVDQLKNIWS